MHILPTFKFIWSFLGGCLIIIGSTIEPSVGVWVVSVGGTLLTISLGDDKTFKGIFLYLVIGVCFGVFGSQVIHATTNIPQIAASFFCSMFGSETTWWLIRSMKEGTAGDFLIDLITKLNPFNGIRLPGKKDEK